MQPRLSDVIVYVSEMERSLRFYRDVLGLPVRTESVSWSELETGSVTLALHGTPAETGHPAAGEAPPGHVEISFEVEDLGAAYEELRSRGVSVEGPRALEDLGMTVATLHDPDGQAILLWQRSA